VLESDTGIGHIRAANGELKRRVLEHTAQLRAAHDELPAFSYSVSRGLRAALRHGLGFAQLLQKESGPSLSEQSLGHLTTIARSAKRMGQLMDGLLAFSRIGLLERRKTEVNLDPLAQETLGVLLQETQGRIIHWDIQPLPELQADGTRLRLALFHLTSNAVNFTNARAEARIEIGCVSNGGGETVIFIRDHGVGFDPKYAGQLFGVFQRLNNAREFEGTGLGWAKVHRIIQRHGGRTWAQGEVGKGAAFYLSIPKQKDDLDGP
jgi:light-regulated signal transduction histidine kinase (bacteriophytochrome)